MHWSSNYYGKGANTYKISYELTIETKIQYELSDSIVQLLHFTVYYLSLMIGQTAGTSLCELKSLVA